MTKLISIQRIWERPAVVWVLLLLSIAPIACSRNPDPNGAMLKGFSDAVASNTNLPKIVSWGRAVLEDTNSLSALERTAIHRDKLPRELFSLYAGPNADVATPQAFVLSQTGNGRSVVVSWLPGSIYCYSLFIGGENFQIPPGSLKEWRQLKPGIFVSLDWP